MIPILRTKLYAPPVRAELTSRPRLLARLDTGLSAHCKLTLISAPAGYGKTTLAAEWLSQKTADEKAPSCKAAWLSLDADDNDPARFAAYWLAAWQSVDATLGHNAQALLAMSPLPPLTAIIGELLNDLIALTAPAVLALDDYHVISNPLLHEALAFFVEQQPPQVHLILITREDPPLPLARLRARGQMTEVRALDLRFTPEETREFLSRSMHLELDAAAIDTLETRTEGWAVGLQLVALALQHRPNRQDFLAEFSGSHRYIIDYLAEEVIRQQDEATQHFLQQTSILDRLCGPLCDALLGETWQTAPSAVILQALEKANLFLIPLDGERRWYRYHQLFADYLRAGLPEAERTALCQKAAIWHAANGLLPDAVHYALASGDMELAADVIAQALKAAATWSGGNLAQWSAWLDALPPQVFPSRPQLSLDAAQVMFLAGRFELAETHLAQAEQTLRALPETPEHAQMQALAALYRGSIAAVHGDFQQAVAQTTFAQARLPSDNHLAHARAFFSLGLAYEIADQTGPAAGHYLQSSREAQAAGVLFMAIHGLCAAAQVYIKQGQLNLAGQTCQTAIQLAEGARLPPLGLVWIILGGIALERNDLTSAETLLHEGLALARQGGLLDDLIVGTASLARLRAYQGDAATALSIAQEALAMLQAYGVPRMDVLAAAHLARLQLTLGQTEAAAQWAATVQPLHVAMPHDDFIDLTLVRVLLATSQPAAIPALLTPLLEAATAAGRMQTRIEALLLLGLCDHAGGNTPSAVERLEESLRLAAPEGYTRLFLDEGPALFTLLPKARAAAPAFVDALLTASQPADGVPAAPHAPLADPLSKQEMRVLELVTAGKSNQDIAAELFISVGTAKWHVHNVLQKLDVRNRAQAIVRARELGMA